MPEAFVQCCFWISLGVVVYTWMGYPLLLAPFRRPSAPLRDHIRWPTVAVVVAAHNEEHCIVEKISNLHEQEYGGPIEVCVVSDGSTDRTCELVRTQHEPVTLIEQTMRAGKNAALNLGVDATSAEILVFTDANAMLAPGALRTLVAPFADEATGLVSGQGFYGRAAEVTGGAVGNAYVRFEAYLKAGEASLGFLPAADGALYAVRRPYCRPLPSDMVHDLMHPIEVAMAGAACRFEADAFTVEPPSADSATEFGRHRRISAQGYRVVLARLLALATAGRATALWILVSHRLLRWTGALFLLTALTTSGILASHHPMYLVMLVGQLLFYGGALAGAVAERAGVSARLLALPYYFCLVHAAGAVGFADYLRGISRATWQPVRSP